MLPVAKATRASYPSNEGPLRANCPKCQCTLLFPPHVEKRSCPNCNLGVPRPADTDEENQLPAKRSSCPATVNSAPVKWEDDEKRAAKIAFTTDAASAPGKGLEKKNPHLHRTSSLRPQPKRPLVWWLLCLLIVLTGAAQWLLANDVVELPVWIASALLYALQMVCLLCIIAQLSATSRAGPFSEKVLIEKGAVGSSAQLDLLDKLARLALVVCNTNVSDCAAVIRGLPAEDCNVLQQIAVRMLHDLDNRALLAGALPAAARRAAEPSASASATQSNCRQPRHSVTERTGVSDSSASDESVGYASPPGSPGSRELTPPATDNSGKEDDAEMPSKLQLGPKVDRLPSDPYLRDSKRTITGGSRRSSGQESGLESNGTRRTKSDDNLPTDSSGTPGVHHSGQWIVNGPGVMSSSDDDNRRAPVRHLDRKDSMNSNNSTKRKFRHQNRKHSETKSALRHSETGKSQKAPLSRENTQRVERSGMNRSDTVGTRSDNRSVYRHSDTNISLTSFTAFNQENRGFRVAPPIEQGTDVHAPTGYFSDPPSDHPRTPPSEHGGTQRLSVLAAREGSRHHSIKSGASTTVRMMVREAADPKHAEAVGGLVWGMDGTAQNNPQKELTEEQAQRLFKRYEDKQNGVKQPTNFMTGVTCVTGATDDTVPTEALLDIALKDIGQEPPSFCSDLNKPNETVRALHATTMDSDEVVDAALARLQRALQEGSKGKTSGQADVQQNVKSKGSTADADREVAGILARADVNDKDEDVQTAQLARCIAREAEEAQEQQRREREERKKEERKRREEKEKVPTPPLIGIRKSTPSLTLSSHTSSLASRASQQRRSESPDEDSQAAKLARCRAREAHEEAMQTLESALHKRASETKSLRDKSPPESSLHPALKKTSPLVSPKTSPVERKSSKNSVRSEDVSPKTLPIERKSSKSSPSTPPKKSDPPTPPEDDPKAAAKLRYEMRKARKKQAKEMAATQYTCTYGELIRNSHEQHLQMEDLQTDVQPKIGELPKIESGIVSFFDRPKSGELPKSESGHVSLLEHKPRMEELEELEEFPMEEDPISPEVEVLPPAAEPAAARQEKPSYRSVGDADPDAAARYEERRMRRRKSRDEDTVRVTYGDIIRASHEQTLNAPPPSRTPRFGDTGHPSAGPTPSPNPNQPNHSRFNPLFQMDENSDIGSVTEREPEREPALHDMGRLASGIQQDGQLPFVRHHTQRVSFTISPPSEASAAESAVQSMEFNASEDGTRDLATFTV